MPQPTSIACLKFNLFDEVFLRSATNFSGTRYLSFSVNFLSKLSAKLSKSLTTYSFGAVFVVLPNKAESMCEINLSPGLNESGIYDISFLSVFLSQLKNLYHYFYLISNGPLLNHHKHTRQYQKQQCIFL